MISLTLEESKLGTEERKKEKKKGKEKERGEELEMQSHVLEEILSRVFSLMDETGLRLPAGVRVRARASSITLLPLPPPLSLSPTSSRAEECDRDTVSSGDPVTRP